MRVRVRACAHTHRAVARARDGQVVAHLVEHQGLSAFLALGELFTHFLTVLATATQRCQALAAAELEETWNMEAYDLLQQAWVGLVTTPVLQGSGTQGYKPEAFASFTTPLFRGFVEMRLRKVPRIYPAHLSHSIIVVSMFSCVLSFCSSRSRGLCRRRWMRRMSF